MRSLENRRGLSRKNVCELRKILQGSNYLFEGKACIYATGSYGRCEASEYSDLDVFIVGMTTAEKTHDGDGKKIIREFNSLDEIQLKAKLIEANNSLKFPPFSNDGKYLQYFSDHQLTETLGTEKDDVTNTFTARLLLILESCALCEQVVYEKVASDVINSYWRDYEGRQAEFVPAFFTNDILRLWRTFCVNYEARTSRDTERKKAKGKLKNYKLKHSRLMTCYSAIIYLLAIYRKNGTVAPEDVFKMFRLSPTGRLENLREENLTYGADEFIADMLDKYDVFLDKTNKDEETLVEKFTNVREASYMMEEWKSFGVATFKVINKIGDGNAFHRMLLV